MPAVTTAGTCTTAAGSQTIVGDVTARAAWAALGTSAVAGRYFRIDGQRTWFRVTGLNGSNDLLLESAFVLPFDGATDPSAGAAYKLVKRFHPLASGLRHIGVLTHTRLLQPLEEIAHQEMDQAMAGRVLVADVPEFWCERGVDSAGLKLVEIYPFVKSAQLIPYSYYKIADALTLDSSLPAEIDLHILKTGALVDLYRWEMSKSLRENHPEAAATWRNEMRAQMTNWDEKIREAVKNDRAGDALSFQLLTGGFPGGGDFRVRTARDYVFQRGNRP